MTAIFKSHFENQFSNWYNVKDEYKSHSVEELKKICGYQSFPFSVCALNIEGDLNVGMMIRTASLMGAENFYIFGRRKIDNRSMVGANNYINVEKIDGLTPEGKIDVQKFKEFVRKGHFHPVFMETGGQPLNEYNWNVYKILLVFGNEGTGIPTELLEKNTVVSIPQRGVMRSLNVASAASIVMWDLKVKKGWL